VNVTASPPLNVVPFPGDVTLTVGAPFAFTVMPMLLVLVWPRESVTDAVTVCGPTDNVLLLTEPPVPNAPSTLDVHDMLPVNTPSSPSDAVPVNVTVSPSVKLEPSAGDVMLTPVM